MVAVATQTICDWANGLVLALVLPFKPGPERDSLEWGNADQIGIITKVPGGVGLVRERTFESLQILVQLRARIDKYTELEKAAGQLDAALLGIENDSIWDTYIRFVSRDGTVTPTFEEDERISFLANYTIEEGL